jgi:hypothetical protein
LIRNILPFAAALAFTFSAASVAAQEAPVTALDKQLSRIDFAITGVGIFNKDVSGPVLSKAAPDAGNIVTQTPSNTFGALATIRYIVKPYMGFEFNYGFARYTENFSNITGVEANIGVQSKVNEYTIGYVVTPPHTIFGYQPYASAGAGSTGFAPTAGGGLGLTTQARATYYYAVGIQKEYFDSHFGLRGGFRQAFFLAPDFGQNFLTILKHTTTSEPQIGVYVKF